jgi:hypothetical protein
MRLLARVPPHWPYVFALFVGSKLVLTLVGVLALRAFDATPGLPPPGEPLMPHQPQSMASRDWFSMWFAWDSFHYHDLAEAPLDRQWQYFSFPLLYPLLTRAVAIALGGNTFAALLVVSNVAYLALLSYAYRWAQLVLGDDESARRYTRYVVLLPTAFLFHAALTESLFVCLAVAAFYHAERRQWLVAGIIGFFLALSRSSGFLVALPLAILLVQQGGWKLGPRALLGYVRTGWPLLLLPAGWLSFMAFCYWQSGDWLAYQHAQERGWGIIVQDPVLALDAGLVLGSPIDQARLWVAVAVLLLAVVGVRYGGPAYPIYTIAMVLAAMSIGVPAYKSILRYVLVAFPIAAVLAGMTRNRTVDALTTAALAVCQGGLFVLWLAWWTHTIL